MFSECSEVRRSLFCRARTEYLASPYDEVGEVVFPKDWAKLLGTYLYGSWDKYVEKHSYKLYHEPLFLDVETWNDEADAMHNIAPLWPDWNAHNVDPALAVGAFAYEQGMIKMREIPTSKAEEAKKGRTTSPTDAAFKGCFQRFAQDLKAAENVNDFWVGHKEDFVKKAEEYVGHVESETFEAKISLAPFCKMMKSFVSVMDPDTFPKYAFDFWMSNRPAEEDTPEVIKPPGGGKKGTGDGDHEGEPSSATYGMMRAQAAPPPKRPRTAPRGATTSAHGPGKDPIDLADDDEDEAKNKDKIAKLNTFVRTLKTKLDDVEQRVKTMGTEITGDYAARLQQLEEKGATPASMTSAQDEKQILEMKSIMSNMATVIAVLFSNLKPDDPMKIVADQLFVGMINQITNVYKWPIAEKKAIFEALKVIDSFKVALDNLDTQA